MKERFDRVTLEIPLSTAEVLALVSGRASERAVTYSGIADAMARIANVSIPE